MVGSIGGPRSQLAAAPVRNGPSARAWDWRCGVHPQAAPLPGPSRKRPSWKGPWRRRVAQGPPRKAGASHWW
ncbi:hypothetical protein C7Y68_19650, partial [Paracidovorax avenae]